MYVDKLSEWVVRTEDEILNLMAQGAANRTTGATKLNDVSSRSHAVFSIILEQQSGSAHAHPHQPGARGMPVLKGSVKVREEAYHHSMLYQGVHSRIVLAPLQQGAT